MSAQKPRSKVFDLTARKPKVLLIGNGVAYDKEYSWERIIERVKRDGVDVSAFRGEKSCANKSNSKAEQTEFKIPYSVLASVVTPCDDKTRYEKYVYELTHELNTSREKSKERKRRKLPNSEEMNALIKLPFDAILTTNYTYEIEHAQKPGYSELSNSRKNDLSVYYAGEKAREVRDGRYLVHTCNKVTPSSTEVWHIHGELRRPTSMILSHNEYAHQSHSIMSHNDKRSGHYKAFQTNLHINSWIDYFLIGDVYILGLGMEYSEFDLWWLLTRRQREEHGVSGKIVFYEPSSECSEKQIKQKALSALGIMVKNLGFDDKQKGDYSDIDDYYKAFYEKAIDDMKKDLLPNKEGRHV